jgi:hypothetical protein
VWSAEKRAEGLEYMHPKPSSHSGRIVGQWEVIDCKAVHGFTSGLPVTREQPTEHAEIAFAEFTFASPLLQGEAIFYLNLATLPFARPFRTISTLAGC